MGPHGARCCRCRGDRSGRETRRSRFRISRVEDGRSANLLGSGSRHSVGQAPGLRGRPPACGGLSGRSAPHDSCASYIVRRCGPVQPGCFVLVGGRPERPPQAEGLPHTKGATYCGRCTVITTGSLCVAFARLRTCATYSPGRRSSGICAVICSGEVCSKCSGTSFNVTQDPPITVGSGTVSATAGIARLSPLTVTNEPGEKLGVPLFALRIPWLPPVTK